MKPKLPRALLWTEIESMEEFLKEPKNREMYDIFLKIKQMTPLLKDTDCSVVRLFNEVYYQCTKIVYEQNPNVQLRDYITDIKSNIGSNNQAKVVYGLIYFLLSHRSNNTLVDIKYCSSFFMSFSIFADNHAKEIFENELGYTNIYQIDLSPRPCATSQLDKILIDWKDVTNTYDKESIEGVCNLYSNVDEKKRVLDMIQQAYNWYVSKQNKTTAHLKDYFPFIDNYDYFREIEKNFDSDKSERLHVCREAEPRVYPTYQELEKENASLKRKLDEALLANDSLKSTLNTRMPKKQQETSFTVSMIVNYCKHIPEYSHVAAIEKMLYRYIKKCSPKEEKLIDSISEHFNNKRYGDTIMGDKNVFRDSSGLNRITLPKGMTPQEAIKLLQNKIEEDGEEG